VKEIKNIIRHFENAAPDEKLALATVVSVAGSSYRRMGARMLVSETGKWVGGISGGCLEGDARKRAKMAILKGRPSKIRYDTTTGDDHQIGVGLGCNGVIDVLFTPIDRNDPENPIEVLKRVVSGPRKKRTLIKVTLANNQKLVGRVIEFNGEASLTFLKNSCDIQTLAQVISTLNKSKNIVINDELALFIEVIPPAYHLILLGHQYDLYPLINQALELGWEITVIAPENKVIPKDGVRILSEDYFQTLTFDDYTAVVLMSHSLKTDKENLRKLLDKNTKYLGILGPKVRSERIFEELMQEGHNISKETMANIYAPIGLEIGATTPDEIALSVLAEIKSVFTDKKVIHLREKEEPIHERNPPMIFN
jgi:xanthine dehydrogenase accessory factor